MSVMGRDLEARDFRKSRLAAAYSRAAELHTAAGRGKHLAGIEEFLRIERAFEALLLDQINIAELVLHEVPLLDANAVLPGEHPAEFDTGLEDVGPESL